LSDLTSIERRKLEKFFEMSAGYVLNFSDRTFRDFFYDYSIGIDDEIYKIRGTSKANRMRTFWDKDSNHNVGRIINALIVYGSSEKCLPDDLVLLNDCKKIAHRLCSNQPVVEMDVIVAIADERDFNVVAEHVRELIDKNQPECGLDRLHTFFNKFIRVKSEFHGIQMSRDKPLHSVFGEYIKALHKAGYLESKMTERILKSTISVLEAFNDVRNNKSLAHDNPILNYEESLLIFNHVVAVIRFIKSLEAKVH
jgi:hypothetical protein